MSISGTEHNRLLDEIDRLRGALAEIRDSTYRNALMLRAIADRALVGAAVQPKPAPKNRCTICGGTDVSPLTFDVWECGKCGDFVPDWARATDNGNAGL